MKEINVILTVHKSFINFNNKLWARKITPNCFYISTGTPDSMQITDIVGIYILANKQDVFPEIIEGLYRDDALL